EEASITTKTNKRRIKYSKHFQTHFQIALMIGFMSGYNFTRHPTSQILLLLMNASFTATITIDVCTFQKAAHKKLSETCPKNLFGSFLTVEGRFGFGKLYRR